MLSLLKAEYKQLFKSIYLYIVLIGAVIVNLAVVLEELIALTITYRVDEADYYVTIDYYFCSNIMIMLFVSMCFIPFYIGKDFCNRTINNKIIGGAKRSQIFLSKFIVCSSAVLIIQTSADIMVIVVSLIFTSGQSHSLFDNSMFDLFIIKFGFAAAVVGYSALNVLLSMCIGTRKYAVLSAFLVYVIMISASKNVHFTVLPEETQWKIYDDFLEEHEVDFIKTDENGERIPMTHAEIVQLTLDIEREACPLYEQAKGSMLSGAKKHCLLFLDDVLPLAQYYDSVQWVYAGKASPLFFRYTVYNTVFTAIFLTTGVFIFKRKDLK